VAWKAGQIEAKGNENMMKAIQQTQGAIAYVGYSYAVSNKLSLVQLKNRAGQFVKPEDYAFQVAVMGTEWNPSSNFYTTLTDEAAKDVWPINAVTYILLHKVQESVDKSSKLLKFFDWIYRDNNDIALQLGFIPLPDSLHELIETAWKTQLKDSSGKPIWQ
jgi:phosphate transport system substrate-binding protein